MKTPLYVWHSVRHLLPRQLAGQVLGVVRPCFERPAAFLTKHAPAFPGLSDSALSEWPCTPACRQVAAELRCGRFRFLNTERDLGWPPDWSPSGVPRLWLFNLHYFDFLWSLDYLDARAVARDWMHRLCTDRTDVCFESYPASVRLVNWVGVFFCKFAGATVSDTSFLNALWASIFRQTEWLRRHLEYRIMGNHLIENAVALMVVGSWFKGREAHIWRELGEKVLACELPAQVLRDGMHYERSPMYELRVAYLLMLVVSNGSGATASAARRTLAAMITPIERMTHPDGEIALFNDSAMGVYHRPQTVVECARRLLELPLADPRHGPWQLPDAGYYGCHERDGTCVIVDAGSPGPPTVPAHAHADIFSFEMSLRGHRAVVDAGVHDYESGDTRRYCRSTRAHNTVEIEGEDQCEFWSAFRVARRAEPRDVSWSREDNGFRLIGWHDGYRRLRGRPIHQRELRWQAGCGLRIVDRIASGKPVRAVSCVHLHPTCRVEHSTDKDAEIRFPGGRFIVRYAGLGVLSVEDSFYHPEFGKKLPNTVLAYGFSGESCEVTTDIDVAS